MRCILCEEEILPGQLRGPTNLPTHRECGLRSVLGGIGHLVDHQHWCIERRDPDGGLSYRESALMCATWVELQGGVEAMFEE